MLTKTEIEMQVNARLVRDILVKMCHKNDISIASPWDPDKEAANFILAQRLGIGSVFGISDNEENE